MYSRERLIRKVPTAGQMNTVKARQKVVGTEKDLQLLTHFRNLWNNLQDFREQRARALRFAYGDQWGDIIEYNGRQMTERQYLRMTGNTVLQTNQVQDKVETMEGVLTKESLEPVCNAIDKEEQQYGEMVTNGLQSNCYINRIDELGIDWMREACLGGLLVAYESWDNTSGPNGTLDSWTSYVNPNDVVFDAQMNDSRFWDINAVGRMLRLDYGKLCARFARSPRDVAILEDIYSSQSKLYSSTSLIESQDQFKSEIVDFMEDEDMSVCMVLEAWTKEVKPRIRLHDTNSGTETIIDLDDTTERSRVKSENARRKREGLKAGWKDSEIPYIEGDGHGESGFFIDEFWYCRFLATDGTILWEGESPLPDRNHPFTIRAVPHTDGKIQGYLWPMIDHNIIMNRAVVLHDWLLRTNAKGVTVVPKQILGDLTPEDFANSWTSIDDMVFIDVKPGNENLMPKVFYGNAQQFDVAKYLDTFARMGDQSTAVTEALQGKSPFAGASGALYAQMTANSSTAIAALLKKIHNFLEEVHTKKMKNIIAYYTPERWELIVGNMEDVFNNENLRLNEVSQVQYDLRIKESTETPVFRELAENDAKEFMMNGLISFDEYALVSKRPWIERIRQHRQARMAEIEAMQASNGVLPEEVPMQEQAQPQQQIQAQ